MKKTVDRYIEYEVNNDYSTTSRYSIYDVVVEGSSRYLETYNKTTIKEEDDDIYHVVKVNEAGRLDLIAYNYYNNPTYWWAIALANNIIDPFSVKEGLMIRIPKLSSLSDPNNEIFNKRGFVQ